MYGTEVASAAAAIARSLSSATSAPAPTGARSSGARSAVPATVVVRSRSVTPCAMRGTMAHRSNAARLLRIVRPSPAPPATYAHAVRELTSWARRSSSPKLVGTAGRRPRTPWP